MSNPKIGDTEAWRRERERRIKRLDQIKHEVAALQAEADSLVPKFKAGDHVLVPAVFEYLLDECEGMRAVFSFAGAGTLITGNTLNCIKAEDMEGSNERP